MDVVKCLECGQEVFGRADKRFCTDHCRATYNNKKHRETNALIKEVNRMLKNNRKILAHFNPKGKSTVHKDQLLSSGFNFNYFTNTYRTRSGKVYFFCYDQGYIKLDNDYLTLVERQEYVV